MNADPDPEGKMKADRDLGGKMKADQKTDTGTYNPEEDIIGGHHVLYDLGVVTYIPEEDILGVPGHHVLYDLGAEQKQVEQEGRYTKS